MEENQHAAENKADTENKPGEEQWVDNEFLEAPKAPTYATNLEELEEPDPDKIKNEEEEESALEEVKYELHDVSD